MIAIKCSDLGTSILLSHADRDLAVFGPDGATTNFPLDEASTTEFYYITNENTLTVVPPDSIPRNRGAFHYPKLYAGQTKSYHGLHRQPCPACAYCSKDFREDPGTRKTREGCAHAPAPEKGRRGATPRRPRHRRKPFQFRRLGRQVGLVRPRARARAPRRTRSRCALAAHFAPSRRR